MVAVAAGATGLYAAVVVRHGLGVSGWVWGAVILVFLVSYTLAASVLLRRPAVAMPGLLGGLFVTLAWLAIQRFTFAGVIAPMTAPSARLVVIGAPLLVGAAGTLWGGSAADGRRIARLAALSAALGLYLYATIAVAVLGAGGPPSDPGSTVSYTVGDRLGSAILKDLVLLPLVTATIAWATATATARLRPSLAASLVSVPVTGSGPAGEPNPNPVTTPREAGPAVRIPSWHRPAWLLLLWAGVAAAVFLAVVSGLRG
jgi:hypothetical protein